MVPLCSEKFYLLLFWSRLVHADLAMHATLAALGTLPRAMSLLAPGSGRRHASRVQWCSFQTVQSTATGLVAVVVETRKPCPMVLVPDSTVHCSRPRCCSGRDSQAVFYGARSRQYSPLLPASLLFWSRLVHADLAMHATLAALGNLPRSMSL